MDNNEKSLAFDAYIDEYKDRPLLEKQTILINELKELIGLAGKICIDKGINYDLLVNREITDINKEGYTQDDFAEAVYTYLQMFKEILSSYILPDYDK